MRERVSPEAIRATGRYLGVPRQYQGIAMLFAVLRSLALATALVVPAASVLADEYPSRSISDPAQREISAWSASLRLWAPSPDRPLRIILKVSLTGLPP